MRIKMPIGIENFSELIEDGGWKYGIAFWRKSVFMAGGKLAE